MNSPYVPNYSFFMNKTNRLRDVLVPIEVFTDMMNYLEDTNIQMKIESDDKNNPRLWVCPYSFTVPARNIIKMQTSNNAEDIIRYERALYSIIEDRINVIRGNAITEDNMNKLDNDPDVGIIVHMTSGRIVPFHYSCVNDIQIINIRNSLPELVKEMKSDDFEDLSKTLKYLKEFNADQKYRMLYCFQYSKEDPFNPKGLPLLAGKTLSSMDLEINLDISSYIITQFHKKEKVICVA